MEGIRTNLGKQKPKESVSYDVLTHEWFYKKKYGKHSTNILDFSFPMIPDVNKNMGRIQTKV